MLWFYRKRNDVKKLSAEAELDEAQVEQTLLEHEMFAIAVTLLSVAITICGIALLSRHRVLWLTGLFFGVAGSLLFSAGVLEMLK